MLATLEGDAAASAGPLFNGHGSQWSAGARWPRKRRTTAISPREPHAHRTRFGHFIPRPPGPSRRAASRTRRRRLLPRPSPPERGYGDSPPQATSQIVRRRRSGGREKNGAVYSGGRVSSVRASGAGPHAGECTAGRARPDRGAKLRRKKLDGRQKRAAV